MNIIKTSLTLKDLPSPPHDKSGWPWTEQTNPLSRRMSNDSDWPLITIVTPSYNQAQFIEETIRSVLLQGYPNLEYIIIDGGSTDGSLEIIKKYEKYLAFWVSEPDRGQSQAINKGFHKTTGSIAAFLNSDDLYLPETLSFVANFLAEHSENDFICGQTEFIDTYSQKTQGFEQLFNVVIDERTMTETCHIAQPSTFFKSSVFPKNGYLNEELNYCFDYDFWLRAFLSGLKFASTSKVISQFRLHGLSKTNTAYQEGKFDQDFIRIYQKALSNPEISNRLKKRLLHGLGIAASLLFIHTESTKSTSEARTVFFKVIQQNPAVLLSKSIWATLLVSLAPTLVRQTWRFLKNK